jgi:hypothetical protein
MWVQSPSDMKQMYVHVAQSTAHLGRPLDHHCQVDLAHAIALHIALQSRIVNIIQNMVTSSTERVRPPTWGTLWIMTARLICGNC